jgi:5-methylcytosine-specific restriction enzyme subunit McrC
MVAFNEQHNNKYFTVGYDSVKFTSYVGVLQVGGLIIEVLPKADKDDNPHKNVWQDLLLQMLRVCSHLKVDNVSQANLRKRYNSILEVYYDMFLNEVQLLVQRGLIKKYRKNQSNQLALKGKLMFQKNIQKNIVHQERFYCEHQVYDRDHLLHQILKETLVVLDNLVSDRLKDKVKRCAIHFDHIPRSKVSASLFERLHLNRNSASYSNAIDIAKMILLNYSPNLNAGRDNMLTLLFNMNDLWEEYIYKVLVRNSPEDMEVLPQQREQFWEHKIIKPDIVIKRGEETYVIDTKWKVVDNSSPSDNDLKQMFAYNLYWKSEKSLLLYPKIDQADSSFGTYHYAPDETTNQCKLGFVSVVRENALISEKELAKEILKKLELPEKADYP